MKFKSFVSGFVCAAIIIGMAPVAIAKVSQENISVNYNNIKIVVDGAELVTQKEPFIYEGITYLPVRAVGEAVGKDVGWDGATQTVTLNTPDETTGIDIADAITKDKVLYDKGGIKITYTGFIDSYYGKDVTLKIENTTDKNYTVQVRNFSANGYMVDAICSVDIAAGKIANNEITMMSTSLYKNGIETVESIEFYFTIFDSDAWEDYADSEIIELSLYS